VEKAAQIRFGDFNPGVGLMKNQMLEEIWAARERIARKNGYDMRRTVQYLRGLEANYPGRIVAFKPRKPSAAWLSPLPKARPAARRKRHSLPT
jgi:hypothetical protein